MDREDLVKRAMKLRLAIDGLAHTSGLGFNPTSEEYETVSELAQELETALSEGEASQRWAA